MTPRCDTSATAPLIAISPTIRPWKTRKYFSRGCLPTLAGLILRDRYTRIPPPESHFAARPVKVWGSFARTLGPIIEKGRPVMRWLGYFMVLGATWMGEA